MRRAFHIPPSSLWMGPPLFLARSVYGGRTLCIARRVLAGRLAGPALEGIRKGASHNPARHMTPAFSSRSGFTSDKGGTPETAFAALLLGINQGQGTSTFTPTSSPAARPATSWVTLRSRRGAAIRQRPRLYDFAGLAPEAEGYSRSRLSAHRSSHCCSATRWHAVTVRHVLARA